MLFKYLVVGIKHFHRVDVAHILLLKFLENVKRKHAPLKLAVWWVELLFNYKMFKWQTIALDGRANCILCNC